MKPTSLKSKAAPLLVAMALGSSLAYAHKSTDNHTHCGVDGKGVGVAGHTEPKRKPPAARSRRRVGRVQDPDHRNQNS